MKRFFLISLVIALLVAVSANFAQEPTIAEIVAGNEDFSTLLAAVSAASPEILEALSNPEAQLTVFAPTNAAFDALPDFVVAYVLGNTELLDSVLLYHVVDGVVTSTDLVSMLDDMGMTTAVTLEGSELMVSVDLTALTAKVDNANIDMTMIDIPASNGVIHVIDAVLVPPVDLPVVDAAFVEGDIKTAGSSTVAPLSEAVQAEFVAAGYTGIIENETIGSGAGIERFCVAGDTDIANASRPIRESEVEACATLNPARFPLEFRVGTDGLAVVVNPANDWATDLTFEELQLAFSTAVTWADVREGFPDEPILRFIPGTDSGTFDFFVEEVFDEDSAPILAATETRTSELDTELVAGIEGNAGAIGFFGYAYYQAEGDALSLVAIDGVVPTAVTVEDGSYSLARPLFIYSDAGIISAKPQVGQFISFYLSIVNDVIDEVGYFPASDLSLRVSKLVILALTDMGM
ncbi:MAG: substrate-binding domain-containing protein [Anaerolineae bacterium]|nr:substrate-binding domain-containing protein [Anaerolineae bacterium]